MLRTILFTLIAYFIGFNGMLAQEEINNYKYIVISDNFEIQKEANQYQLNALIEFLYNKYGYNAHLVGKDLPVDVTNNNCLNLKADVIKVKGGMLKTKVQIVLKDCFGKVIATSKVGESRLKDYDKAYTEALRDAFKTFQNFDYKYTPKETTVEVEKQDEDSKKEIEETKEAIDTLPIKAESTNEVDKVSSAPDDEELYYAQAVSNGYQLVDSQPKIVMVLLATAAENIFIVKGKNAIVFKEDGFWYYSENNGKLGEKQSMNIKF